MDHPPGHWGGRKHEKAPTSFATRSAEVSMGTTMCDFDLVSPRSKRSDKEILAAENDLDEAYRGAAEFDNRMRERWILEHFEPFTRRTEDPKLGWLEHQLTAAEIPHVRYGESWHAPILMVAKDRVHDALAILNPVDGCPDDDDLFYGFNVSDLFPDAFDLEEIPGLFKPHDYLGDLGEDESSDPRRDGWVDKNTGLP